MDSSEVDVENVSGDTISLEASWDLEAMGASIEANLMKAEAAWEEAWQQPPGSWWWRTSTPVKDHLQGFRDFPELSPVKERISVFERFGPSREDDPTVRRATRPILPGGKLPK
ncbi:hypothetical protein ONE63_008086 [Megalurothrips usitatus]|uniref:Uncharacterized protein n=1 Tax=Megalurothrips usitatus TaxID=439358 RepID=A0AAV7XXA8_9NEOP|nr:hypothetical protein ONE63_008086 [Megalurothrips usitatus]